MIILDCGFSILSLVGDKGLGPYQLGLDLRNDVLEDFRLQAQGSPAFMVQRGYKIIAAVADFEGANHDIAYMNQTRGNQMITCLGRVVVMSNGRG